MTGVRLRSSQSCEMLQSSGVSLKPREYGLWRRKERVADSELGSGARPHPRWPQERLTEHSIKPYLAANLPPPLPLPGLPPSPRLNDLRGFSSWQVSSEIDS